MQTTTDTKPAPQHRDLSRFNGFRTATRTILFVVPLNRGQLGFPTFKSGAELYLAEIVGNRSDEGECAHRDPILVAGEVVHYVERVDHFFDDDPASEPIVEWIAKTDKEPLNESASA